MNCREQRELMRNVGRLEGIVSLMIPEDPDDTDTIHLIDQIRDIAHDMEALASGADHFDISKYIQKIRSEEFDNLMKGERLKGGGDDDA